MNVSRNFLFAALVVCTLPAVASEAPEAVVAPVVEEVAKAGVVSRVASAVASIGTVPTDWIASVVRADKFANYLATPKEGVEAGRCVQFFANHKVATSRFVALAITAATVAAAYKAYQVLTAQEEDVDAEDEYDFGVFGDDESDFDAEEAE